MQRGSDQFGLLFASRLGQMHRLGFPIPQLGGPYVAVDHGGHRRNDQRPEQPRTFGHFHRQIAIRRQECGEYRCAVDDELDSPSVPAPVERAQRRLDGDGEHHTGDDVRAVVVAEAQRCAECGDQPEAAREAQNQGALEGMDEDRGSPRRVQTGHAIPGVISSKGIGRGIPTGGGMSGHRLATAQAPPSAP